MCSCLVLVSCLSLVNISILSNGHHCDRNETAFPDREGLRDGPEKGDTCIECFRHTAEFCLVREVRLEKGLGVGQSPIVRRRLCRRLRDLSVRERSGWSWQERGQDDVRPGRR